MYCQWVGSGNNLYSTTVLQLGGSPTYKINGQYYIYELAKTQCTIGTPKQMNIAETSATNLNIH